MGGTNPQSNYQRYAYHEFKDNNIEHRYRNTQLKQTGDGFSREKALIRFNAPAAEEFFPQDKRGIYDNRANRSFMLRVYSPRKPASTIAIIFNGLDETIFKPNADADSIYAEKPFEFYDDLGQNLSESGILSILLPTPYHLNRVMTHRSRELQKAKQKELRAKRKAFIDMTVPTNALMLQNHNIYRNHFQGFRETVALVRFLTRRTSIFEKLKDWGNPIGPDGRVFLDEMIAKQRDLHISLVGYSLGGLRAITEFLRDRYQASQERREPVFSSCVAINAGGGLHSLPHPPWVSPESWTGMIRDLLSRRFEEARPKLLEGFDDATSGEAGLHYAFLDDVFLGQGNSVNLIPGAARSMLFVLGGGDTLVPLRSLRRFAPPGGLNLFQVAGMGHILAYDREWQRFGDAVFKVVAEFIGSWDKLDVSSSQLARTAALLDHAFDILPFSTKFEKEGDAISAAQKTLTDKLVGGFATKALGAKATRRLRNRAKGSKLDRAFLSFANDSLSRLNNGIQNGTFSPTTYMKERRRLLIGFHFLPGGTAASVQLMWEAAAQAARAEGLRFGRYMLRQKLIDQKTLGDSQKKHFDDIEQARAEVAREFGAHLSSLTG